MIGCFLHMLGVRWECVLEEIMGFCYCNGSEEADTERMELLFSQHPYCDLCSQSAAAVALKEQFPCFGKAWGLPVRARQKCLASGTSQNFVSMAFKSRVYENGLHLELPFLPRR